MDKKNKNSLAEKPNKKSFLSKIFHTRPNSKKVLKLMKLKKISNFLFYTDVDNVQLILESGIKLLNDKDINDEFIVWTYLENENSLGLEFENSTRTNFWKWITDAQSIDISKISVIGIDAEKLFDNTKKDWAFDDVKNIIYVYENIPVEAISWILVKEKSKLKLLKIMVESNNLDIDIFLGEKGNVESK